MSSFDLSFMSVPSEGGMDGLATGVAPSPKDGAPSDAFAQLLARLSSVPEEDLSLLAASEAFVEEVELSTEALSASPDGWEEAELEPRATSAEDDADEATVSPVVLTALLMPITVPDEAVRQSEGNQSIEETGSAARPVARGTSEGLTEVVGKNAPDSKAVEATQAADAEALESTPQPTAGTPPAASSPELPVSTRDLGQFEGSVPQARDKVRQVETPAVEKAAEKAQPSGANAASRIEATPRERRSEAPAASTRQANSDDASPRIANTPSVNVQEIAASLERRMGNEGESQPDLTPKTPSVSTGSVGQPQQVVQTFHHAVAAALHAATSAAPTTPPPDPGGLDNQIVQGIRRLWRDGSEEIRVTLRPEYLGALTISLKVDQNVVSAVLHVDEPQVRAWVQAHEAQLRQAMTSQGLSLEQLVVTDEKPDKGNQGRDAEARQHRRPNAGRTSDEPAPVFEVAV